MKIAEFEDLVDRLGDDVSRWPDSLAPAARALLAESDAARAILAEATVLRRALASTPVRAPAGLADRIMSEAARSGPPAAPAKLTLMRSATVAPAEAVSAQKTLRPQFAYWIPAAFRPWAAVLMSSCFVLGALAGHLLERAEGNREQVDLPTYVAHVVDLAHSTD
jgi:hypothetical protein